MQLTKIYEEEQRLNNPSTTEKERAEILYKRYKRMHKSDWIFYFIIIILLYLFLDDTNDILIFI